MAEATLQSGQERFAEQLVGAVEGAFTVFTVYIGDQLGLYEVLAGGEALTPGDLAARTGTTERYVREWCEQQTVAGILTVEDERAPATERRYSLPVAHVEMLTDADSLDYLAPLAQLVVGAGLPIHDVLDAFRTGGGVPFADYSPDLHEGQARINRPAFRHLLGSEWLPAMADVHERLLAGGRVADIGCGFGDSCLAIARAYPSVHVDGYDLDAESVAAAREAVAAAGLEERVTIHHRDASDPDITGEYDLVTAFECVHDMADPVGALRTMRRLAGDGTVFIADERVGETFTAAGGTDFEWMMYGWSVLHCLPVGMADQPSAETGTVMRPDTLRAYAEEAGFESVEVLPIEHDFFRFYRLEG